MRMKNDGSLIFEAFDKFFSERDESGEYEMYLAVPGRNCNDCTLIDEAIACDRSTCVLSRHCKDTHFIFCGSFRES